MSAPDCAGRNVAQWAYEAEETSDGCAHSVYDEHGKRLTEPYIDEANARLIAAAPELLEALKDAAIIVADCDYSMRLIDSAIAKAEGR